MTSVDPRRYTSPLLSGRQGAHHLPPGAVELHCHAYGSIAPEQALQRLLEAGPDHSDVARRHQEAYGSVPDLRGILTAARRGEADARSRFRAVYQLRPGGGDRWARFQAKYSILTAASAFRRQPRRGPLTPSVARELRWLMRSLHAGFTASGHGYAEIRFMLPAVLTEGQARQCILQLLGHCRSLSDHHCRLDLALSLPRAQPDRHWNAISRVLLEHRRADHLTAVDFCHSEDPRHGEHLLRFAEILHAHNQRHRDRALALLVHAGEQIHRTGLAGSLASVEQALQAGAHRIGHACILGLPLQAYCDYLDDPPDPAHGSWLQAEQQRLIGHCQRTGTPIEVSPRSNELLLGLPGHLQPHPQLLAGPLPCILVSDDPGILGPACVQPDP